MYDVMGILLQGDFITCKFGDFHRHLLANKAC
jgi:hypothetical protein